MSSVQIYSESLIGMDVEVKILKSPEDAEAVRLLRTRVFVDEQGVPPDTEIDEYDSTAIHAVAYLSGVVVGTGRLILDTPYDARIGRMAVESSLRRTRVGSAVLIFLENIATSKNIKQITLHAQHYVKEFYAKCGYVECGDPFLEAGILHVEMKKVLSEIQ